MATNRSNGSNGSNGAKATQERSLPRVAIAGATGNAGKAILKHLLASEFKVTILSRKGGRLASGQAAAPKAPGASVVEVDFGSLAELTEALRNHDAVVDASRAPDDVMDRLIDAASDAGVYRFVPSDFSLDPLSPKLNALPIFAARGRRHEHLAARCRESGMTWTSVANGPFLDWNLRTGFMNIDIFNRKATLMDGGNNAVPWTSLDDVGRAVAELLLRPGETENRAVFVQTCAVSPRRMLELCQDAFGTTRDDWEIRCADSSVVRDGAMTLVAAGKIDMQVFGALVAYANSQPDMAHPWGDKCDNELLGIKELSDAELMQFIRECAKNGPIVTM